MDDSHAPEYVIRRRRTGTSFPGSTPVDTEMGRIHVEEEHADRLREDVEALDDLLDLSVEQLLQGITPHKTASAPGTVMLETPPPEEVRRYNTTPGAVTEVVDAKRAADTDALIDAYYDSLGLSSFGAEDLRGILESNRILDPDTDINILYGRAEPTASLMHLGFQMAGETIGETLVDENVASSYRVAGIPLTGKMMGGQPKKRQYAYPAVLTDGQDGLDPGLYSFTLTDPRGGKSIASHPLRGLHGEQDFQLGKLLSSPSEAETLGDFHERLADGIVNRTGRFDDVMSDFLAHLQADGHLPQHVQYVRDSGDIVDLSLDPHQGADGRYVDSRHGEQDIAVRPYEVAENGILTGVDNHTYLAVPMAMLPDVQYGVRFMEPQFLSDPAETFMEDCTDSLDVDRFPFFDIASPAEAYGSLLPYHAADELVGTQFAGDHQDSVRNTGRRIQLAEGYPLRAYVSQGMADQIQDDEYSADSFPELVGEITERAYRHALGAPGDGAG
ncbi:MAG: hypothetical protein SVW02_00450 [Candidatus Nanohaloarchaea archaeon]|nr:hypothetical protein [Candidatus Nanohaloarchaea archaeon]